MEKITKKLGIIGGMGPLATSFFFNKIIEKTEATRDQDHIDMIILNHASIPDRTESILSNNYNELLDLIIKDAKILEKMGVSVIAIPCNTSHFLYKKIQASVKIPIINMVKESILSALKIKEGVKKIGIMATNGTLKTEIYKKECEENNVEAIIPSEEGQKIIMDIIYNEIKKGSIGSLLSFMKVFDELKNRGCDIVLLACTELSYFKENHNIPEICLDTLDVLAEKSIGACDKKIKKS